jgi:hypothetical protein
MAKDECDILCTFTSLNINIPKPSKILRIGKYSTNKARSIKICFDAPDPAKTLLRNKNKLPENIRIYSDQTPAQISFLNSIRDELKRRESNGETDLTIKYFYGMPTIVKSDSKNEKQ